MTDQAYTLQEFAKAHKIAKTKTCKKINSGRLQVYKVGTRTYVSTRAAQEWQRRLEEETQRKSEH